MTKTTQWLAVSALACAATAQQAGPIPDNGQIALESKIQRSPKWILPSEQPTPIATGFRFTGGLGAEWKANIDGEALLIDADADGTLETRIEGEDGFVVLASGDHRYGVMVAKSPEWSFRAGSAMVGKIGETKIQLIDQNHNGRFNDVGEDAMVVGSGRAAGYLSESVSIDGRLYAIEVAADGSSLKWRPFAGESGSLVLSAVTDGKVLAAVLKSKDGRHSVHLSKADADVRLPAGEYVLDSGVLSLAGNRVQMRTGRSKSIEVVASARRELHWGGPVKAEFTYDGKGAELTFDPQQIWFYGAQGEEYFDWNPVGKSPRITVTDKATGKEIAEAWFPGSC